jgi:glycosyltransferase involved in cell wall biosynthesis
MRYTAYLPHGIDPNKFFPIDKASDDGYMEFEKDFKSKFDVDFVVFYNSRNIRRKQPSDVILGFKYFCETLPENERKRVCLVMKTHIQDPNGTDLLAVKQTLCPDLNIVFVSEHLDTVVMNYFYNLADVTVSMSSAEGFGLSLAESLMAGTMIIAPVHGGMQDQMGFQNPDGTLWNPTPEMSSLAIDNTIMPCGSWVYPLRPNAKQLQGSLATPYIYDYVTDAKELRDGLYIIYKINKNIRDLFGLLGRDFVLKHFNSKKMCSDFVEHVTVLLDNWNAPQQFTIEKI